MTPKSKPLALGIALVCLALWAFAHGCSSDTEQPTAPHKSPKCSVSPNDTLRFGNVVTGKSSSTQSFSITNTGGGTLSGSVSESCPDFEITSGSGSYNLAAGESVTVQVRFTPQSTGPKTCTIDTGTPCSLDVSCTGNGLSPSPVCSVSQTTPLSFGSITVGQSSSTQSFSITNAGGGTLSGSVTESCLDFEITSGGGSYNLATGQSVTVQVRFAPQSVGAKTCTIDTGTPCSVDVSCTGTGTALPPVCSVSQTTPLSFGTISVGQSSSAQSFSITNTGGGTLSGSVSESCPDFEITSGGGSYNLTAGQSVTVRVRFTPQSVGAKNCTIDTGTPCSVDVSCTGTGDLAPVCSLSKDELDFETLTVGEISSTQSFSIKNTGGGILSGDVSENCPDFEITSGGGSYSLAAGESVTVELRFSPQTSGYKSCVIYSNTVCNGVFCLGTAMAVIPPYCVVVNSTLDFGTIKVGNCSYERWFSIQNQGGGTLSGTVSASCESFEIVSGGGPYNLAKGVTLSVGVRFCPKTFGYKACTIDTGTPCSVKISCTGFGSPF